MKLFPLIALAVTLTSCTHIYGEKGVLKDREYEYLNARSIPPLKIPPGYASDSIQQNYPVSDRDYSLAAARVGLSPPGINNPGK